MLYTHFTEKLIGLQDLIVTKVESCILQQKGSLSTVGVKS